MILHLFSSSYDFRFHNLISDWLQRRPDLTQALAAQVGWKAFETVVPDCPDMDEGHIN
jgi:hypothetical protein